MDELTNKICNLATELESVKLSEVIPDTDSKSGLEKIEIKPIINEIVKPIESVETEKIDLELLKEVFTNKDAQRGLIALYSESQSECIRNGKCGMEIGMAREKDQTAVLKHFLGEKINLDIDNTLTEDFIIGKSKISSKHSSGKIGKSIKAKWTSADISVKEAIESLINAPDSYYPNLLITYIDTSKNEINIICISSQKNKDVIKGQKEEAFTVPKGNSRGIEYSKKAMVELLKDPVFKITIENAKLAGELNAIERRIEKLKSIGINPNP